METLVEEDPDFGSRIEEISPTGVIAASGLEPVEDASQRAALAAMAVLGAGRASGRRRDRGPLEGSPPAR
jgi:hypothetical protein